VTRFFTQCIFGICMYIFCVYVVNVNAVIWYRVEQELMARIVCEMHDRHRHNPVIPSQLNPGRRLVDHASEASSDAADAETTDDPVIGSCQIKISSIALLPMCSALKIVDCLFCCALPQL